MSWICSNTLLDIARDLKYVDHIGRPQRAMESLSKGADIGCEGDRRLPKNKPNSNIANKFGVLVSQYLI